MKKLLIGTFFIYFAMSCAQVFATDSVYFNYQADTNGTSGFTPANAALTPSTQGGDYNAVVLECDLAAGNTISAGGSVNVNYTYGGTTGSLPVTTSDNVPAQQVFIKVDRNSSVSSFNLTPSSSNNIKNDTKIYCVARTGGMNSNQTLGNK